ncbi:hypothetical protein A2313_03845 [Candidatus Roizmanbacteria bacterium RIFOXYB2_FULL_41_10]|nr:MAG: hypothetical protein A2262_04645 [Candidatus Roizmanbacteria bacterium RIFOXYA2_FULL_41_8]OGK69242.1 MAG: hypothetical protein A2313_03845 [Candidatus Roizmanbacteria bacterium RIFOXYB2_FULL_41_10]OGZ28255.1 MAG: hypothetical protein A2562_00265 [Candidatus Nealsonbacteria bacterium RIFOXYD1_FULL_39_11]
MNKNTVALIRGAFLNPNELANYEKLVPKTKLISFSSKKPLGTSRLIKNQAFSCPYDYSFGGLTKYVFNRTLGDSHWLIGMEKYLNQFAILDTADPYYFYSYQAAKFKQRFPQTKLVCTYCDTLPHNNETTLAKKRLKQLVSSVADLFVVHTKRSRECLLTEGADAKKIKLIRLGVDLKRFKVLPKTNGRILSVGRLVPEKGTWPLYQVFKELLKKYPQLSLTLVGSGPLEKTIRQDCQKNNLQSKVHIYTQSFAKIHLEYQQAQIFVLNSKSCETWEEQYGMALIEAMASGLPIVTTDSGAIPEVVNKAGIICPQNKTDRLYQALDDLLAHAQKQRWLGHVARTRAEKYFDSFKFAATIRDNYDQLLNRDSG